MTNELIYLSLGSNIGDKRDHIDQAMHAIEKKISVPVVVSSVYQTEAWGNVHQDDFLNLVTAIETSMKPMDLLNQLLDIERAMGRIRMKKNDPRIIDIDILLYKNLQISQPDLIIPHPKMQLRKFVLIPMNEIAPNLFHPVLKKSMNELLNNCNDHSTVIKSVAYEIKSE